MARNRGKARRNSDGDTLLVSLQQARDSAIQRGRIVKIHGRKIEKTKVEEVLTKVQCVFCKGYSGGNMMRKDCSCQAAGPVYCCEAHQREPGFECQTTKSCQTCSGTVTWSVEEAITMLMEGLHGQFVRCPMEGCSVFVKTDGIAKHLSRQCDFNQIPCQKPGCGKTFLAKEKSGHSGECDSAICQYTLKSPMLGFVGCTWVGNRKERDTHQCALGSPDQAFQTLRTFVQFVTEKLDENGIVNPLVESPEDDQSMQSHSDDSRAASASTSNTDDSEQ